MNPADSSIQGVGDYTTKLVERDDEEFGGFETEFTSYADTEASYRASERIKKGGKGSVIGSDGVDLRKGRKAMSGFSSVLPTTTRITDSIAIYLPPNVQEPLLAGSGG